MQKMENIEPRNPIEEAAAMCDIPKLTSLLIDQIKIDLNEFDISSHIRACVITELMKNELWDAAQMTRDEKCEIMIEMLEFLVVNELDFSKKDDFGRTCLMRSTFSSDVCYFLLENGVDVNAVDDDGNTALFYAAASKEALPTIDVLMRYGIDPRINFQNVLLNTKSWPPNLCKHLILRCVDLASESLTGEMVHSVIASSYFKISKIFSIAELMMELVVYSREMKVKIFEYLAHITCMTYMTHCKFSEEKMLEFWKAAARLRSVYHIKCPPFRDPDELHEQKMVNLCFFIVEHTPSLIDGDWLRFVANCVQFLSFDCDRVVGSQNEQVTLVVRFLLNCCDLVRTSGNKVALSSYWLKLVRLCHQLLCSAEAESEKETSRELIASLVKLNSGDNPNVLHVTFYLFSNDIRLSEMIEIMVESGVDIGAKIFVRNAWVSALHYYLDHSRFLSFETLELFLQHGAHIDEKLSKDQRIHRYVEKRGFTRVMEYVSLACLAACAIVDHKIKYVGRIPSRLHNFINIHE